MSPFSLAAFFSPLDPNHPVQLQLQCSLSSQLQPSILFVSILQVPVVFFKATYISLLSSSVLFRSLNWPQFHCVHFSVCARVWLLPWVTPSLNPDSSALFLLLWWMLVCFSFAGRIVALWEQVECFSAATGVLGVYICSFLNNVRGEFILVLL